MRTVRLACITLFAAVCAFEPPGVTQQLPAIRVAGSPAVRGAIAEISRRFEAQTGVRVDAEYDVFTVIKRRIDHGETFDIVVLSPELIHDLVTARTVVPETVSLGSHGVGLAARAGQALPDIQTAGALTQPFSPHSLLAISGRAQLPGEGSCASGVVMIREERARALSTLRRRRRI